VDTLYWLHQIQPSHRHTVGNKAFYLGQMGLRGYPVLPGFVIPAPVGRHFLEQIDWRNPLFADLPHSSLRLDIENPQQLQAISQRIRQAMHRSPLAADVQHSLTTAIAQLQTPILILRPSLVLPADVQNLSRGFQESALFNSRISAAQPDTVLEHLKQLWAELFGSKSLFYWQRLGIPLQQVGLSVVVQPIQSAIAAGTIQLQSQPPTIQATVGLGVAIARGEVNPDRYHLDGSLEHLQSRYLGTKSLCYELDSTATPILQTRWLTLDQQNRYALPESQLAILLQLTQRLHSEFATAMAAEWVLTGESAETAQCFLTQLRLSEPRPISPPIAQMTVMAAPVTSEPITPEPAIGAGASEGRLLLRGVAAAPGRAIAKATVISSPSQSWEPMAPGTVLIAPTIPLDYLEWMHRAAAIVTEQGTATGHSAIVAREVGIPAVVGAAEATQQIRTGDLVLVDGNTGRVYRISSSPQNRDRQPTAMPDSLKPDAVSWPLSETPETPLSQPPEKSLLETLDTLRSGQSAIPPSPLRTQLLVNLSQPEQVTQAARLPVTGVGLLRAELLAISLRSPNTAAGWREQHPTELIQSFADAIQQFAQAFGTRPIFYRSLDLRSHEFKSLHPSTLRPATNPALGIRGTFSYCVDATLFDIELAALAAAQQAGAIHLNLLLPFVRTVEEFQFCRDRVAAAGLFQQPNFQLWIMAEVPSILFLLPEYVKAGVQGISIGSNDLTQLVLGVDRDHEQMVKAFPENHPAVMAAIAQLIQQSRQLGIPCSICGELPARYPAIIPDLIRWGITSISVGPAAVEQTYTAIATAEAAED
jgi:pyruvate, water dikinase